KCPPCCGTLFARPRSPRPTRDPGVPAIRRTAMLIPSENEMFDPRHYEAVRRPLLDAETLPAWCYTSERFYRREVERIFGTVWNFLGSADRIPNPGDFFTLDFAGVPLIVLRDGEGNLRAFANSCRHRGSELLSGH